MENTTRFHILFFVSLCFAAICAGLFTPVAEIYKLFPYIGFYSILVALFLWTFLFFVIYAEKISFDFFKRHFCGLVLSILLICIIFSVSPPRFKVFSDEANLMGTSTSMYVNKKAMLPIRGYWLDYAKPIFYETIDQRPLLFPLLVCAVHSIRGFNSSNGFIVNFISGICLLFVFYLLVSGFFSRFIGLVAMMLMASLPVFTFWVTSSGFETINLLFIILFFYFLRKAILSLRITDIELLLYTYLLLSQCRYESVFFFPALLGLIHPLLKEGGGIRPDFKVYLIPLLFIPVIWQPMIFKGVPVVSQVGEKMVGVSNLLHTFSFSNLVSNFSKNFFVLSGFDPNFGFSIIVAILFFSGTYFILRDSIVKNAAVKSGAKRFFYLMAVGYFLPVLVLFSFYLGDMTIATQNRFSLFLLPLIIWPALYILNRLHLFSGNGAKYAISIFFVFHFIYFLPYAGAQYLANTLSIPYEYEKTICALKNNFGNNKRILVIADNPNLYIIQKYSAVSIQYFYTHMDEVKKVSAQYDHIVFLDRHDAGSPPPHASMLKKLRGNTIETYKLGPNARVTLYDLEDL